MPASSSAARDLAMAKLTTLFAEPTSHLPPQAFIPPPIIEKGAKLGKANVTIGAYAYVCAGAVIGDNCVLHPQTYIGPDAVIGRGRADLSRCAYRRAR